MIPKSVRLETKVQKLRKRKLSEDKQKANRKEEIGRLRATIRDLKKLDDPPTDNYYVVLGKSINARDTGILDDYVNRLESWVSEARKILTRQRKHHTT